MTLCAVCGKETTNKIACGRHTRLNSQWKSYNNNRRLRGQPELGIQDYIQNRKKVKPRPRLFDKADLTGPTVVWDGTDRSPCAECEHGKKDHHRYGCIKCEERHRFAVSHGVDFITNPYDVIQAQAHAGHYLEF